MNRISKSFASLFIIGLMLVNMASCGKKVDSKNSSVTSVASSTKSTSSVSVSNLSGASTISNATSSSKASYSGSTGTVSNGSKPDTSGQIKNLNGRTIKMQAGIMVTAPDDNSTTDGKAVIAFRKNLEKTLNCKLQSVNVTFSQMQASVLAGAPACDIWNLGTIQSFMSAYQSKLIQPLEPLKCVDFTDRTKFSDQTDLFSFKGQHYAIRPQAYGIWRVAVYNIMFVKKSTLSSAGISIDTINNYVTSGNWTWDKFEEVAKKVSDVTGKPAITDADSYFYRDLMASNGVDWLNRDSNGNLTFNAGDKKAQEVITYYQKLINDKVLSVDIDSSIGGTINLDNEAANMENDFDLKNFVSNKYSCFLDSMAYLPWNSSFGSQVNDISVLFCPKPQAGGSGYGAYKSYTESSCPVAIPVYTGSDALKKSQEAATVLQYIFSPYKTQAQYNNELKNHVMTFQGDTSYMPVYQAIYNNTFFSYKNFAVSIARGTESAPGWLDYIPKIAKGATNYSSVVNAETTRYNNYLKQVWTQK